MDIVFVVTSQNDACYLKCGWKESNEGDVAIRSEGGGILLISSLIVWLIICYMAVGSAQMQAK